MFPTRLEKVRKTYTPQLKDVLETIRVKLEAVELPHIQLHTWELVVDIPCILNSDEMALVRYELWVAGWGMTTRYLSNNSESIIIYCR